MYPILFRTRYFFVYSYTAVFILGILLAIGLLIWREDKNSLNRWANRLLAMLAGALLCGRLSFLLTQLPYFQERPDALWRPWQGGITYHGAWLGALFGLWLWHRFSQESLASLLDALAVPFSLLVASGWLACWLEGCAYGAPTTFGLFSADLPDDFGVFAVRYQTQLLGMVGGLLVLGWAIWYGRKGVNGRLFLLTTLILSIGQGLITLWRGDTVIMLGNGRIDTWLHLITTLICILLLQYPPYRQTRNALFK
jgi:phosphatidylglycerol:prolipoprotein diacylglycerol transferase